jgi:hypothetical protein
VGFRPVQSAVQQKFTGNEFWPNGWANNTPDLAVAHGDVKQNMENLSR